MNEILQQVLPVIFFAIIVYMLMPLIKLAFKKIDDFQEQKVKNRLVNKAIDTIQDVVLTVTQTYVDAVKKNENWNDETQKEAFELAKGTANRVIPEKTKLIITEEYNNLDAWLAIQIQLAVKESKKEVS
ncbi:hypothetical protein [Clostridium sp.]|uniref:hypothetical protein n=1 Tax=Clostridium sp. TaxID=1506 RepID=UPI001A62E2BD|nr:hypothetical protein [Clostridium sp.]MBK5234062.1 hypothetical protein [Clostridium sp.]